MKVLVTGGTGFLGSAIVRDLLREGSTQVAILSRDPEKALHKTPTGVKLVRGDVMDAASLAAAVKDQDAIVHCVQFPNHPVQNPKKGFTYERIDGQGTENLCKALAGSAVKRLVYLSGAGTSPEKTEPWFRAKIRAERAIQATGRGYVILRPSWIYGPGDRTMNKFLSFARLLPFMPVVGDGRNRAAPVFVGDLARIVTLALKSDRALNQVIDVGGPQVLTMDEIQSAVPRALGKRRPLFHQPLWLMKFGGSLMTVFLRNPPLSAEAVDFVTADIPVSCDQVKEIFGLELTALSQGLEHMIK